MKKLKNELFEILPAWMPGLVLLVVFPMTIYIPNKSEFSDSTLIFFIFFSLTLISLISLFALNRLGNTKKSRWVKGLFLLGCYLLIADIVAPVQVGALASGTELMNIAEPLIFTALQIALFVAMILVFAFTPWNQNVRNFASLLVMILFFIQIFILAVNTFGSSNNANIVNSGTQGTSIKGNIYHIVFDTYGQGFRDHVAELNKAADFDGFTLFENALTNADHTRLSLPSFMVGILPGHDPDGFNAWQKKWLTKEGLLGRFTSAGYQVSQYQHTHWNFTSAVHTIGPKHVASEIDGDSDAILFSELVLLRAAPTFLKQEVFPDGHGLVSRIVQWIKSKQVVTFRYPDQKKKLIHGQYKWGPTGVHLIRRMIKEERSRPKSGQYVFAHVPLPHNPFNIDRDGETRGITTSWHEQALACVNLMTELIATLKEQGKYQDAMIIFQGDHGEVRESANDGLPEAFNKKIRTLLLIKPVGVYGSPIVISGKAAQLVDIAPTLFDLVGLKVKGLDGQSLFSNDFPTAREIHVFCYRRLRKKLTNELMHFSYKSGMGWKQHPNFFPFKEKRK